MPRIPKDRLCLELDGKIDVVEYKNNKEISRETIDGKTVLKVLLQVLTEGLEHLIKGAKKK